jgi:hypothetical protein
MSSADTVFNRIDGFIASIGGAQTEQAVTTMVIAVGANSDKKIPVARGNLLRSKTKSVQRTLSGWDGALSYTSEYAGAVHEAKGIHLGKNTPRSPASLGNIWDVTGEPKFLEKGAKETAAIQGLSQIARHYIL